METPTQQDYNIVIDALQAEIKHLKIILTKKDTEIDRLKKVTAKALKQAEGRLQLRIALTSAEKRIQELTKNNHDYRN